MSELQFWGVGTVRCLRPIWVAEELGLSYRLHPIGPRTGETRTAEYTSMNPKQKVPFCKDGEFKLSESLAICRYVVEKYGDDNGLSIPADPETRARLDEWLCFVYGELDETSLYVIRRHGALAEIYGTAPAAISSAETYARRQLAVADSYLRQREYLIGEKFGLADVFLVSCLDWVKAYGIEMPVNLNHYHQRLQQRPAYRKARAINQQQAQ